VWTYFAPIAGLIRVNIMRHGATAFTSGYKGAMGPLTAARVVLYRPCSNGGLTLFGRLETLGSDFGTGCLSLTLSRSLRKGWAQRAKLFTPNRRWAKTKRNQARLFVSNQSSIKPCVRLGHFPISETMHLFPERVPCLTKMMDDYNDARPDLGVWIAVHLKAGP
jgi:hypothetical protein